MPGGGDTEGQGRLLVLHEFEQISVQLGGKLEARNIGGGVAPSTVSPILDDSFAIHGYYGVVFAVVLWQMV